MPSPTKLQGHLLLTVAAACLGATSMLHAQGAPPRPMEPKPNQTKRSRPAQLPVPLHRTRRHDGPSRRHPGHREGSDAALHRLRHRRRMEVHRRRQPLEVAVRQHGERVHRRHRHRALRPQRRLRRHAAKPTTARAPPSATACGAPPTAVRPGTTSASRRSQSINRIAIDPTNPKIVFVASPGHLFGPNPDRGLYRTTDGGATWKNVKFIDENTGFNDVAIDPSNPKIIYASSFERRRNGWGYNGGGNERRPVEVHRRRQHLVEARRPRLAQAQGRPLRPHRHRHLPRQTRPPSTRRLKPAPAPAPAAAPSQPAAPSRRDAAASAAAAAKPPQPKAQQQLPARPEQQERAAARVRWRRRPSGSSPRPQRQRRLPLRRRRQDLDLREQPEPAPHLLLADSRRPQERQQALRRRHARPDVARRRQDLEGSHRLAHRLPRHLDQPRRPSHRSRRPRRRPRHLQRRRLHLGLPQRHRRRPVLSGLRRHASPLHRLRRPAG